MAGVAPYCLGGVLSFRLRKSDWACRDTGERRICGCGFAAAVNRARLHGRIVHRTFDAIGLAEAGVQALTATYS